MMYKLLILLALVACITLPVVPIWADHPKPSVYPISWELKFEHS